MFIVWVSVMTMTFSAANAQQHIYDAAGRLIWSAQPSGASTSIGYDPAGNVTSVLAVAPGQDTDEDGIPDSYELRFTGSVAGLDASDDWSGDGSSNLVAFAFGRDPFTPAGSPLQNISAPIDVIDGETYLVFTYLRPREGTSLLVYQPQVSWTLDQWSSTPEDIDEISVEDQGGGIELVTIRARLAIDETKAFGRIRIHRIPQP